MSAERDRAAAFGQLDEGLLQASDWYLWGPYLSERQWATVREDYSPDGAVWEYFPHDHARSRAYRWGEDGMAGFSDVQQRLCVALALWNGLDPILKERMFGLTGNEGNHGEDVKEYWWYVDAVPSHSWNRWRYHYAQKSFPYEDLVRVNSQRDRHQPEYELVDTGIFDESLYWVIEVDYAKAGPLDLLMVVRATNAGPQEATLHVLPTLWYRNTWSWGDDPDKPELSAAGASTVETDHPLFGQMELYYGPGPGGAIPELVFCENETNFTRLYGAGPPTPYPKDGINDHVTKGQATVNPAKRGSKCAIWYQVAVGPGQTGEFRVRLRQHDAGLLSGNPLGDDFERVIAQRAAEADEFYAELTPGEASPEEARVMRQAFAGMLWTKQFYCYDVTRWLDGDPGQPPPPAKRLEGRNASWRNFDSFDILSVPDKWEYPWFAAWDLGFHCVALAHVDPAFAKYQLVLLCREWFQHRDGALPAYEWDFSDVNPPVQAWAALEVFAIDGARDIDFLSRVFDKLLVNFTWWINREDAGGSNLFEGGFLGLDNIGPIDRSHLPPGTVLKQSDATGWMAFYSLTMGTIAAVLQATGQRPGTDLIIKFLEHFAAIREAIESQGMWDDADGLFYDQLALPGRPVEAVKVRSMVSIIPLLAAAVIDHEMIESAMVVGKRFADFFKRKGLQLETLAGAGLLQGEPGKQRLLLSVVDPAKVEGLLEKLFDEEEFLSPHGLRSLSLFHRAQPYELQTGTLRSSVDYEPAESTTPMFGGNSNWRGPVWFPLNYLVITALEQYHWFFGDELEIEYPTRSGQRMSLDKIAKDIQRRLISIFLPGPDGRRPCFGAMELFQHDNAWKDNLWFNEYFHGDNGTGLGASHQTGWTGVVADAIRRRYSTFPFFGDVLRQASPAARATTREDASTTM
jgi:hypothetical protein